MGRPRKDASRIPMEQRIEDAFWQLIVDMPIDRISVGQVTQLAGCNRSTFYYYFTDVYSLLDQVIEHALPHDLPAFIMKQLLSANPNAKEFAGIVQTAHPSIDRLCILLASPSSSLVTKRVKCAMFELWEETLAAKGVAITGDARIVLEFTIGGMLALMAYRAESGMTVSVDDNLRVLAPEVPVALAKKLNRAMMG